ncbi:MAG: hypothetical protein ACON4Z_07740, partial [Planctomycetota bacterium]
MLASVPRVLAALALAALAPAQQTDWLLDPSPYRARLREEGDQLVLENGLIRLRIQQEPLALVGFEQLTAGQQLLRAAAPLGEFTVDGAVERVGGLIGQPNRAFLLPEWLEQMARDPAAIPGPARVLGDGDIAARIDWRQTRHASPRAVWPPRGRHVSWRVDAGDHEVVVHLQVYDGLPLFCHWLEWRNTGDRSRTIDRFTSLRLPVVEAESRVEPQRTGVMLPNLYVETDFSFHAMTGADGSSHCVRWTTDPEFGTQVNYRKETLCVLDVGPELGPSQTVAPGGTF